MVDECEGDVPRVILPRAETHLAVRIGAAAPGGLDLAAIGGRAHVHRKRIRGRQGSVLVRVRLGAHEAVLGAPASALTGRIVMLDELWGGAATRRLAERLADAHDLDTAATLVSEAIAERLARVDGRGDRARLVRAAADRLHAASVGEVARELAVSERSLRRLFREQVGLGPKAFARVARFHRALRATRGRGDWATAAVTAGYYDQAHLIAECRALAGVTPTALLAELGAEGAAALG